MTAPTKANPFGVYVYHNTEDGLSVALDYVKTGEVFMALSICSPNDNFSKKKAQLILRNRLSARRLDGKLPLTVRLGDYNGSSFKDDVFVPILDFVRDSSFDYFLRGGDHGRQNDLTADLVSELEDIAALRRNPVAV
jgi:hypothetical protein